MQERNAVAPTPAERWYHFSNTGLQNQDVLNAAGSPDGEATVFLDPNQLSDDGTVALGSIAFTYDGAAPLAAAPAHASCPIRQGPRLRARVQAARWRT